MHHIRDCLPEIKSKLNVMMQNVSQELTELGEPTDCVSAASLGATLVRIEDEHAPRRGIGHLIQTQACLISDGQHRVCSSSPFCGAGSLRLLEVFALLS